MASLGAIEAVALKLCVLGAVPLHMPRTLDLLCDAGLIDNVGAPTADGQAAWTAHADAKWTDALRRNVLPHLPDDALAALGRLYEGREEQPGDWGALSGHGGLVSRTRAGVLRISVAGRRVVELARQRTEVMNGS